MPENNVGYLTESKLKISRMAENTVIREIFIYKEGLLRYKRDSHSTFHRLDYISERYCAGLKTKSLKIQT